MPHEVWNLGPQTVDITLQARRFIAGIEPARRVVIGRSREPKRMMVFLDAWIEVNDIGLLETGNDPAVLGVALAVGKDPLNTALLLPVAEVIMSTRGDASGTYIVRDIFKANGIMLAAAQVAIRLKETGGGFAGWDVDVHLDWTWTTTDWWTWFVSWNELEAAPDGSLIDGERSYA